MLRFHVLGEQRLSVAEDGSSLSATGRSLGLLVYLVLHAGQAQHRGRLAGLFWPDSTEHQARTNLRRELHNLREIPGTGASLISEGQALLWRDSPGCYIDVRDFDIERELAFRHRTDGDPVGFRRHAAAAIADYKGDLMPGWYDDWVLDERDRLRQQCAQLCDLATAAARLEGDHSTAMAMARRRIQLEPLEEAGYQVLMKLQAEAGGMAAAVGTYHRCASVLETELGVAPGTATRQLVRGVLTGAGGQPPVAIEERHRPADVGLVARNDELAQLQRLWRRTAVGGPAMVLVSGEAGVGKSRLVSALAAAAAHDGALTALSRCYAASGRIALAPVADWLRAEGIRGTGGSLESDWGQELSRLLPGVSGQHGQALPAGPAQSAGPPAAPVPDVVARAMVDAWQRQRFFEAMARAILASGRHTLLVIDDLQWCDEETMTWLAFLLTHAHQSPLLVAATVRGEELERNPGVTASLRGLRSAGLVTDLGLAPLDATEATRLAESLAGRALTAQEKPLFYAATGGYPLFVVEAAQQLGDPAMSNGQSGPSGLRAVLRRRLEQTSAAGLEVAGLAAALGREFSLDLLAEATDLDQASLVQAVDELWRRRILREQNGGYDFTHDLLRQVAYDAVSPARRWLLHRRLAQALELVNAGRIDSVAGQLAEQYRLAGRPQRAVDYYLRAADVSATIFANAQALSDYTRSLEIVATLPAGKDRDERELDILQRMSAPLTALRGYSSPRLRRTMERSVELAERLGHRRVLLGSLIGLFASTFVQGETALAYSIGSRSLTLAEETPDLAGQAHFAYAGAATSLGHTAEAIRHFDLACELAPDTYSFILGTRVEVHARAWSAHAHWLAGDDDGAVRLAADAVDRARRLGHPYSQAVALAYAGVLQQIRNDTGQLAGTVHELRGICDRYHFAYYGQWGLILQGWLSADDAGLAAIRAGIGQLRTSGAFARMAYWLYLLADRLSHGGNAPEARAVLDAAEAAAAARDDHWWLPEVLRLRAGLETGPAAAALMARAYRLARQQDSPFLADRCRKVRR